MAQAQQSILKKTTNTSMKTLQSNSFRVDYIIAQLIYFLWIITVFDGRKYSLNL